MVISEELSLQIREWLHLLAMAVTLDASLTWSCFQRLDLVVLQNLSCLPITQAVSFFLFFTKHSVPAEVRSVNSLKNDSFPRGAGLTELQVHGCLRIKGEKAEDMSKGCSGFIVCIIFRALLSQGGQVPYV